ncbi:MAG: hypothetical protein KJO32_13750 [Deltaproteobacteria bacterium]|nr:hypothetical protein [Deltaproteobacteria bacterium]
MGERIMISRTEYGSLCNVIDRERKLVTDIKALVEELREVTGHGKHGAGVNMAQTIADRIEQLLEGK